MIPKILHYCWFGNGPMNALALKCMESWKKYCPDYQVILWNEQNVDIAQNMFIKEAYEHKKWAFVTDYVRLHVLYQYGGIYLDSDVELLKNLDPLLGLGDAVTSYQECTIPAALMMAIPQNPWIGRLLSYYDNRHFCNEDGSLELTENDKIITVQSIRECGFRMGDNHIDFGNVRLLEAAYFGPYKLRRESSDGKREATYKIDSEKTYAIHHGIGSWDDSSKTSVGKIRRAVTGIARRTLPDRIYMKIKSSAMMRHLGIKK